METPEMAQALKTAQLECEYESALRLSYRVYDVERERASRLQHLLLQFENDDLQQQLATAEAEADELQDRDELAREQLAQLDSDLVESQNELRARSREVDRYKTELSAMNTINTDSTKLLTEKLALAREVAALKPELEHLRSQGSLNQNILAEKLALQRELSTLQVELETERRAVQRTSAKPDDKLSGQLEDLKKELAKERRDAQKGDRESRKQANEWESQKTILESKLEAFRTRLRSTKEQLADTQKQLEEQAKEPARPRKRLTAHFDPDSIDSPPAKKVKTSLPGDKSTFSITPFLNRTMSILPDSPERQSSVPSEPTQASDRVLQESKPANRNRVPPKPRLNKVLEDVEHETADKVPELKVNPLKGRSGLDNDKVCLTMMTMPSPELEHVRWDCWEVREGWDSGVERHQLESAWERKR